MARLLFWKNMRLILKPDWDPNNPYHYHANGKKVVITKEDWEKYKDDPTFKEVRAAVEAEQAAHPGPEYDEIENPAWRTAYQRIGVTQNTHWNGSKFVLPPLPDGYSRDSRGIAMDANGNYYAPVKDMSYWNPNVPFFVNNERSSVNGNTVPVRYEQVQMPARTIRQLRQPLPVDKVMNVKGAKELAINDYIKNNTKVLVKEEQPLYASPSYGDFSISVEAPGWNVQNLDHDYVEKILEECVKKAEDFSKKHPLKAKRYDSRSSWMYYLKDADVEVLKNYAGEADARVYFINNKGELDYSNLFDLATSTNKNSEFYLDKIKNKYIKALQNWEIPYLTKETLLNHKFGKNIHSLITGKDYNSIEEYLAEPMHKKQGTISKRTIIPSREEAEANAYIDYFRDGIFYDDGISLKDLPNNTTVGRYNPSTNTLEILEKGESDKLDMNSKKILDKSTFAKGGELKLIKR